MAYSAPNTTARVRVDAQLSREEADALQQLLARLTFDDCRQRATNDNEAHAFIEAAVKMRRLLAAAEELPVLPVHDD